MIKLILALVALVASSTSGEVKFGSSHVPVSAMVQLERAKPSFSKRVFVSYDARKNYTNGSSRNTDITVSIKRTLARVGMNNHLPRIENGRRLFKWLSAIPYFRHIGIAFSGCHYRPNFKIICGSLPSINNLRAKYSWSLGVEARHDFFFIRNVSPQLSFSGIFSKRILLPHLLGRFGGVFNGFQCRVESAFNIIKSENRGDKLDRSEKRNPETPRSGSFLRGKIALFALIGGFGLWIGSKPFRLKRDASSVGFDLVCAFAMIVGGGCLILAVMGVA